MQIEPIASCEAVPARADFTADLGQLDAAVSYLARRVIERRNTHPILSNIVIDALPGGEVILTATDCDIWGSFTIAGEVESPGRFTVSGQALADLLAKARKTKDAGSRVRMIEGDNRAAVHFSRNRYNLPVLPADDFPMPPICDDTLSHSFTVPAGRFLADLAALAPCEDTCEQRYYLRGTALQVRDLAGQARLVAVATDGNNLAVASRPLPDGAAGLPDLIIPSGTTDALRRVGKLATGEALRIERHHNGGMEWLSFDFGALRIDSKLIDGNYPEWSGDAVWQRAAPNGEGAALFPELLPGAPVKALADMAKAAGGNVAWQDGKHALLGTVPGDDGLALLASKVAGASCGRKGFEYEANGHEEAKAYLLALAEARGLPLPGEMEARAEAVKAEPYVYHAHPPKVRLITDGLTVRGLTIAGKVLRRAWTETVQDWENLIEREVYHAGGLEPLEGSYSILMPAEGPALEYASEIIGPDGVAYPVAMDDSSIHLSKDQVRALAGEADTRTVKVRTADGREAFVHAVAWEGPGRFLCICKPNGRDIERGIGSAMYVDRAAVIWTSEGGAIADASPSALEPVQAQAQPLTPAIPTPEPVEGLTEALEPEIETVDISPAVSVLVAEAPSQPEPGDSALAQAMRAMIARLDAIEATVATLSADKPVSVFAASDEREEMDSPPIAEQAPTARPARSPAHERAVRRAWAERRAARLQRAIAADHLRMRENTQRNLRVTEASNAAEYRAWKEERVKIEAERDRLKADWEALQRRTIARLHLEQDKRRRAAQRARRMLSKQRADCAESITRMAAQTRAAIDVYRAEIDKLKRDMADPAQPERASDIARLMQERDTARNALAAVQARADRQKEALDQMAGQFEGMVTRVARAEAAMRRAGLIAAA